MKLLNKKGFVQKILIVLISITLINFAVPIQSEARDVGGKLFNPIFQFVSALADVPVGLFHHFLLGTTNIQDSVRLDIEDVESENSSGGIWYLSPEEYSSGKIQKKVMYGPIDDSNTEKYDGVMDDDGPLFFHDALEIPNILYCPEYIFANRIAALDVNFINPGKYTGGEKGANPLSIVDGGEEGEITLSNTVASWYRAFRNVAVVGLLSILVYIGIRILIGSTAQDKAKYKERIKDWLVGLCLLFVMHYIMAGTMMITEVITTNLGSALDDNAICVEVNDYDKGVFNSGKAVHFKTNFMGYIRFMTQSYNPLDSVAYLIMYIALVIYTVMFTITYLKRVLYMAFFTMIAPLVAMTYPLDKLADGKAQGFNMWMREYMMNAIIQPVHLIIYMVIMGSVMDLATKNPIYGLVAIGFLLPAEKFIKKMFRFDRGETTSTLGAVAGGALAMKGVQNLSKLAGGAGKGGKDGKIRTADNKELSSGKRGKNDGIPAPESIIGNENSNNNNSVFDVQDDENPDFGPNLFEEWDNNLPNPQPDPNGGPLPDPNAGPQPDPNGGPLPDPNGNPLPNPNGGPLPDPNAGTPPAGDEWNVGDNTIRFPDNTGNTSEDTQADTDNNTYGGWEFTKGSEIEVPQGRFRRTAGALAGYAKRSAQRKLHDLPDRLKDRAISGAKTLPGNLARMGAKVAGAAALGAVAAGAGLTTGDLKSAASMAAGGAMIGTKVGGAVGNRPAKALDDGIANASEVAKSAWYTDEDKQQQEIKRRQKFDEEWKLKEDNYKYLRGKDMNDKQAKKFLEDANTQKFLDAGITDINIIHNARKMMDDANKKQVGSMTIDGAVARAQLAKSTAENFSNSATQQEAFKKNMKSKNSNLDETQLNKLVDQIIKIKKTD